MTRTHAARQLLAHGPLSFRQFAEITGWPRAACRRVLAYLVHDRGEAELQNRIYRMTDGTDLPSLPDAPQQPAFRPGADGLPAVLRAPGGEDATEQGAGQGHAGRDCPTPWQSTARAGAAAGGRDADRMTTQPEKTA